MQSGIGQVPLLSSRQLAHWIGPSIDSYTLSRVILLAAFASSKPPFGPRVDFTRPTLTRRCSTLARWASEAWNSEAISLTEHFLRGFFARKNVVCRAKEAASEILNMLVMAQNAQEQ